MKKLTVLLATLFVFFSADAQQILSGIYSGSMYNDTTKMLTKYELALSEYRGKVFGYSYNTFIVNDTFYYGIRRVKGYKTDKGELVLEDEELLANNFPESPAKRIKRTATFQLAQEDTITSLTGSWQTNRTRQYYSVGGATKTERSVDSSQSPLVAHLKELNIISDKPNYQDDPVVKTKKKDDKKPKDKKAADADRETGIAKRNEKKEAAAKPAEAKPDAKTSPADNTTAITKPARDNAPRKEDRTVAASSPIESANASKEPGTNPSNTVASTGAPTNTPAVSGTPQTTDTKPAVAVNTTANNTTTNNTPAKSTTAPTKEAVAAAVKPASNTGNPTATPANDAEIDPTTGDLIVKKPATATNKPVQNTAAPVSSQDVAKTADKKAAEKDPVKAAVQVAANPAGTNNQGVSGVPQHGDKAVVAASTLSNTTSGNTTTTAEDKKPAATTASPADKPAATVAATAPHSRTSAVIRSLEIVNDSVTLSFYDNGVVDGDVISVFVNGENVVASQRLNEVAIKKTVHLTNFAADSVEVTLVAETLGSIPPNTGLVLVHDGDMRYDVRFSADMKTNASIIFRKRKK
ncbi:MAG TPA: hypothetical protein VGE66_05825 [Chitinophagaceae bacterium]